MANNQLNKLLEFANIQMAAEAFLVEGNEIAPSAADINDRLRRGNTHVGRFTEVQAAQFTTDFEVLTQYRNDSLLAGGAGFSGTLFKNRATGELTLSFRSTEFIDDAVRDTKATNDLEIKNLGWAFGQIAEMEAWYSTLRENPDFLEDGAGGVKNFNVTGYSLGGHLATTFNILRREEANEFGTSNPITATYTFNGAGTGTIFNGRQLTDLIADFNRIRADYTTSPEWMALSLIERNTLLPIAQSRVDVINAERIRVADLSGVERAFSDHQRYDHQRYRSRFLFQSHPRLNPPTFIPPAVPGTIPPCPPNSISSNSISPTPPRARYSASAMTRH